MATESKETIITIAEKSLPAFCPNPAMPRWSSHPRVFLEFDQNGNAKCPYCGSLYHVNRQGASSHA